MKNKLSVIIIAKNEEKNIGDCLDSISWADEIVLVDDYSDDNTEKIIKLKITKIKLNFLKKKWIKDLGIKKTLPLKQATHDWILSIDCDERVTRDLAAEIKFILVAHILMLIILSENHTIVAIRSNFQDGEMI